MPVPLPLSAQRLERGEFVLLCYRLGRSAATGVLTLQLDQGNSELLILRRGQVFTKGCDTLGRLTRRLLETLSMTGCCAHFDAGLAAYPPSIGRPFSLLAWAREHLESQIDSSRAMDLVRELAGVRLVVRQENLPAASNLDASDHRMIQAMQAPRRLDQIWPLARVPRFRLMAFLHFLRSVGALRELGVASQSRPAIGTIGRQQEALRTLGLSDFTSTQEVKRAYRQLARRLHPDLSEGRDAGHRRACEQRLADVNSAYRELMAVR